MPPAHTTSLSSEGRPSMTKLKLPSPPFFFSPPFCRGCSRVGWGGFQGGVGGGEGIEGWVGAWVD